MKRVNRFCSNRPSVISLLLYPRLRTRVNELIEIGELLKRERAAKEDSSQGYWARRRGNKADRQTVNKFKQAVYMLENDVEELKLCHENYAR